jgi:hypothetical protein
VRMMPFTSKADIEATTRCPLMVLMVSLMP